MKPRTRDVETMLAAMASGAERANRPTAVVAFSVALLVASLAFAMWSMNSARAATRVYERTLTEYANVERLSQLLEHLAREQERSRDRPDIYAREPRLLSTISQAAPLAGIDRAPIITGGRETVPGSPLVRQIVNAQIDRQDVSAVMEWITIVLRDIPGLHIIRLNMRPTTNGWQFQIRFGRWEVEE